MRFFYLVAAGVVILAGCATPERSIQSGPDAEVTYDGLVRVDNASFKRVWIDPTVDLSRYKKIMPGTAEFEFRAVREVSASAARRSGTNEFPVNEANQLRLENLANEIFNEELQKSSRFTMVDSPGADVLIVRGAMLDIVSRVPPEITGRGDIYLDRVGEVTLVLELADSMSGETLARAAERGAAQSSGGRGMRRSNSVNNMSEVRRLFRRWAVRLREGLDSL